MPGMRPCHRCGVPTPVDDMRRMKIRTGAKVWVCGPCLGVWRRLKVKVR